jgi:hypothetical protein|tara:strand:- start:1164 stop:1373 length:210 start_codon:yes stop_codon:yes gene_type:complete
MTEFLTKEFIREEEDGSKTITYATNMKGIFKMHNNKGPAIINKEQKIKEYYLYGVKLTKEDWERKRKLA